MPSKRVYITLPEDLIEKVEKHNAEHPEKPLSYSGACKKALEEALKSK